MRVGAAFDIDGVLLRGRRVLPGASSSLSRLQAAGVPFVLLTNGGGVSATSKAASVSKMLGMVVRPEQIVVSHSPMRQLVASRYADKRVLVLGSRESTDSVAREIGLRRVITAKQIHEMYPEMYTFRTVDSMDGVGFTKDDSPVESIFIVHDPIDWHLELQVALDLLRGWLPLSPKPKFSGEYPYPRLAQGSFIETLKHLWLVSTNSMEPLKIGKFGKPHRVTFDYAEKQLFGSQSDGASQRKIFMVGDNPAADIRGANLAKADNPTRWTSILVLSGMTTPEGANELMDQDKPDIVANDVNEAVNYILKEANKKID